MTPRPASNYRDFGWAALACAVVVLWASFGLLRGPMLGFFYQADSLLPASLGWNLFHPVGRWWAGWWHFQQPRVPSLVPDQLIYLGVDGLTGSWRVASLAYGLLSLLALALGGGWAAARLAGVGIGRATLSLVVLLMPWLALQAWRFSGGSLAYFDVILPVDHGGPFLLSVWGFALLPPDKNGKWRDCAASLLALLGAASDPFFLCSFVGPWVVARVVFARQNGQKPPARLIAPIIAGGLGLAGSFLLFRQQSFFLLQISQGIFAFVLGLRHVSFDDLVWVFLIVTLVWIRRQVTPPGAAAPFRRAQLIFIACSMIFSFLGMVLLYVDASMLRYAMPVLWWPIILAAAWLARRSARVSTCAAALVVGWAGLAVARHPGAPATLTWHLPLEQCLSHLTAQGKIHDGLGSYWLARTSEASSDWRLQIEPIRADGSAKLWGNDPFWFRHARLDPTQPPHYDFILTAATHTEALRQTFGAPSEILQCPGTDVWRYSVPNDLSAKLAGP